MDMWCPYGIGRESWDREVLRIVCSPFPPRGGDLPSGCVSHRGCKRIGAQEIIDVVVAAVVVDGGAAVVVHSFITISYLCARWTTSGASRLGPVHILQKVFEKAK